MTSLSCEVVSRGQKLSAVRSESQYLKISMNKIFVCQNLVKLHDFLFSSPGTSALVESMSLVMNV